MADQSKQQPAPGGGKRPGATSASWRRVQRAFRWHVSRGQVLAGVLLGLLGFAATVQVATLREDDSFSSSSRTQLVQYLDTLQQHTRRLESEIAELEEARNELGTGADKSQTAARQAEERKTALGILAGTERAQGPGIRLTISGTDQPVTATLLINAVEELRDAGAEAIEVNDRVRIVAGSYILNAENGLRIDGTQLSPPYVIDAIGDPKALSSAMGIPGGVSDEVSNIGGRADIEDRKTIRIDALHRRLAPKYAKPVPPGSDGGN